MEGIAACFGFLYLYTYNKNILCSIAIDWHFFTAKELQVRSMHLRYHDIKWHIIFYLGNRDIVFKNVFESYKRTEDIFKRYESR